MIVSVSELNLTIILMMMMRGATEQIICERFRQIRIVFAVIVVHIYS